MMTPLSKNEIQENFEIVSEKIARAAQSVGRDPKDIRLVVVTKGHPVETVQAVIDSGAQYLGENYVEDAVPKIEALKNEDVEWHMIGHVQSRKARRVCKHFSWMHSLDRLKLANRLNRFAGEIGKTLPVLLECNISGEESKFGYPLWEESHWPEFVRGVASLIELPNLEIRGLMTMPPFGMDPEESRPYFQRLCQLRDDLKDQFPERNWNDLSMGMSNDYEVAAQEGATIVRVGTAIVGSRY